MGTVVRRRLAAALRALLGWRSPSLLMLGRVEQIGLRAAWRALLGRPLPATVDQAEAFAELLRMTSPETIRAFNEAHRRFWE